MISTLLRAEALTVEGFDLNGRRIAMARRAATRLACGNVSYEVGDARDFKGDGEVGAAYMLDIVHHIPPATVPSLLRQLHRSLPVGGSLVVKDVDARPAPKRWFTWVLDKAMAPTTPVHYWAADDLTDLLESTGFRVRRHLMVDVLPYPHVLYACERRADAPERRAEAPGTLP